MNVYTWYTKIIQTKKVPDPCRTHYFYMTEYLSESYLNAGTELVKKFFSSINSKSSHTKLSIHQSCKETDKIHSTIGNLHHSSSHFIIIIISRKREARVE